MGDAPPQSILHFVSDWAVGNGTFKRSKVPMDKKILGVFLSYSGFTYREAAKLLGGISHVAVHDAYKSVFGAFPRLQKKDRTVIIEENAAYLNSTTEGVIWMARDADSGEILALRCSVTKSPSDGRKFIESVLQSCNGRPLLRVGRGPGFPHSLKSLDYYFKIDTSGTQKFRQRISTFFFGGSEQKPA